MILALLSDIHANLEALEACLSHARANGAERFAFLGDLVGYGADASQVVDIVMRYSAEGALAVRGNHDHAVEHGAGYMNAAARQSVEWARRQLSGEQKAFLSRLPLSVREDRACFVHASATSPERWKYVDSPGAALDSLRSSGAIYTFSGHVHDQLLFAEVESQAVQYHPVSGSPVAIGPHRRWLALVGSVGQPRDGRPAAGYSLFDADGGRITFFRVPYDHGAAADKIRKAGLPAALALRVEKGI